MARPIDYALLPASLRARYLLLVFSDVTTLCKMSAVEGIVLQKSKVAGLKIFRENTKQRASVDSYDLNRATKVACEFCARP
jgi:hypothetical protein